MCVAFAAESDHGGVFSFRSLHEAFMECRKGKRNTANAQRFEAGLLDNLRNLSDALTGGTYQPTRSVCFVTNQPKLREIFAADFSDRVVHHLLVPRLEKVFEPKFIHDSYACRLGRGTHAAVQRLQVFMHRVSRGGRVAAWFMQMDIRSFFMSIDRRILCDIIARHITDKDLLELARLIIGHDCTAHYVYKGSPGLLNRIPPHKSLFHVPPGKGLPIGNLTSQFFANVYLNELDQFVKHTLKAPYYLRYVDDCVLLAESREELVAWHGRIVAFLDQHLQLALKQEPILKRLGDGVDFLGYIVRPNYVLVRNRVAGNLRAKLRAFKGRMVADGAVGRDRYRLLHLHAETVHALRQTLASYLGHCRHANAYTLVNGLWARHAWLAEIFSLEEGKRLRPCYEPLATPGSLKAQYRWAVEWFGAMCIFFQVGNFFEFFGEQAERAAQRFGCALVAGRRGLGCQCGFPVRMLKSFKARARQLRLSYVVIGENGYLATGLKRRMVTEKLTFQGEIS